MAHGRGRAGSVVVEALGNGGRGLETETETEAVGRARGQIEQEIEIEIENADEDQMVMLLRRVIIEQGAALQEFRVDFDEQVRRILPCDMGWGNETIQKKPFPPSRTTSTLILVSISTAHV